MKIAAMLMVLTVTIFCSCARHDNEYIDLRSGKKVLLVKDEQTGYMVNTETRKPVYLYVEPSTNDTFYGRTAVKVNGKIRRSTEGGFVFEGDDGFTYKDCDYKVKVEDNTPKLEGDVKIKYGDDGSVKIKADNYKKKVDANGDVKIKDGDTKITIKDGKKEVKRD